MNHGYEVIDGWVSPFRCGLIRDEQRDWLEVDVPGERQPVRPGDGGGPYRYQLAIAGRDLDDLYERARCEAQRRLGEPVALSPFSDSAVTLKRYPVGVGQQGWHYDTNGITALLYLNTCEDGGATTLVDLAGSTVEVRPVEGRLLLMEGRRCWHCANPAGSVAKEIVLFNLYRPGDSYRPAHTDSLIRGEHAIEQ